MIVFLIIIAVLAVLITAILCLSATITLVYENGWHTKLTVLFIERDIQISKILSFLLFPEKKAKEAADKSDKKKKEKIKSKPKKKPSAENADCEPEIKSQFADEPEETHKEEEQKKSEAPESKPVKPNPIKKLWDEEGIVGILSLVSNLLETANSAILTIFRGLHIYSLYVMIIVGGGDADYIARSYGTICKYYYPVKGIILNGMKVDNYDDVIQPDFIAPSTEFQMQLIASMSVGLIVKMALKAAVVFLKNFIKDKKSK